MRHHGEGTYYREGRYWCWRLRVGGRSLVVKASTNEARRRRVKRRLDELSQLAGGTPDTGTVAAYLRTWLDRHVDPVRARSTATGYRNVVEYYLVPELGRERVDRLTTDAIQDALNRLATRQPSPLSPATVAKALLVLSSALGHGVARGALPRNPAAAAHAPKQRPPRKRTMPEADIALVLGKASPWRYGPLLALLVTSGLRISEALGLLWRDVDLEAGTLAVLHKLDVLDGGVPELAEVKKRGSRRVIPLGSGARLALQRQQLAAEEDRKLEVYANPLGLVFTTATGKPVAARNVQRALDAALAAAKLPHYSLHDLRRSFLTALASKGTPPHILQAIAGHEQASTTMRYYVTPFEDAKRSAVESLDF